MPLFCLNPALTISTVVKYYDTIEERPVVSTVEPGYLRKLLPEHAPEDGEAWADIQKDVESKIVPGLTHWYTNALPCFCEYCH